MADTPAATTGGNTRSSTHNQPTSKAWKPVLVFLLFTVAITMAGYAAFLHYKEKIRDDSREELKAIAALKVGQVSHWMMEHKGDAQVLSDDALFVSAVDRWLGQRSPRNDARTILLDRLKSQERAYAVYGYTSVSLYDDKATLRLSSAPDETPLQDIEKERLLDSMRGGQVALFEVRTEIRNADKKFAIDLVAPLRVGHGQTARPIGAVLFRIDPYLFLFPMIQNWPAHNLNAETLLVGREGDKAVLLNQPYLNGSIPFPARLALDPENSLIARAAMGQEGLVEAEDYRDEPVIAMLSRIPGASWSMISKIDKADVYAPLRGLANWMEALMLALAATSGGIAFSWRQKEKKLHRDELERLALARHLDYLAKYANDIIILLDSRGRLVDFNDRALDAFGYSSEELSRLNIDNLRAIDFSLSPVERFRQIEEAGGALVFDTMLVRRNGEAFPAEASVRQLDIAGETYYQGVVRDITERKQAADELAQQKDFVRQIIDSDPNLIFVKNADGKILLANEAMAKIHGLTPASIVGKYNWELSDNREHIHSYDRANLKVIEARQELVEIEKAILADGDVHLFQTHRKPLPQPDGSIHVLTIAMDVTELKKAENALQTNNRALRLLSLSNIALVNIAQEQQLLEEVCKLIVETGGYRMAWVGYAEDDTEKSVTAMVRHGFDRDYLKGVNISWADTDRGHGPTGTAIRTGQTQINQNFASNPCVEAWRVAALERGFRTSISLPLRNAERTFGALTIYSAVADDFDADEVALLEELANNLAWGIMALRTRTERERAVEELRQSEEHFRFLTENSSDMIYLMSLPDARYTYVSPSSTRLTGYTPEEFYNTPKLSRAIVHPASWTHCKEQWEKILGGEIPGHFEFQIIHKSGATRWMLQRNAPIWKSDDDKALESIQCMVTDITEQKLASEQLQLSNALLTTVYETSTDGMLVVDTGGKIISFNRQFVDMWGIPPDIIESRSDERALQSVLDKVVDPERFLRKVWHLYVHTYENSHDEIPLHDGKVFERYTSPLVGSQGKYYGRAWYFRDITERKQAERELLRQKTFLHQVIDTDPNLIYVKDAAGKYLMANQALANFYNTSVRKMIGKTDGEINPERKGLSGYLEPDVEAFKHERKARLAESSLLADGRQQWYLTIKKPFAQQDGSINVLGIAVDITRQKLSEIELAESYKELQRLASYLENAREDERTRIARELHDEMGATLAALKMRIAWLASRLPSELTPLSEETAVISGLVSDGIHTLRQVVSQLRPTLLEDVGLDAAITDYVRQFRQATHIECSLLMPGGLELGPDQSSAIFRILQESLNNVMKHAQASKVDICFIVEDGMVTMTVEDDGIGFSQFPREKTFGLLGIRERALMAGGSARISSAQNEGTRVTVEFPISHPTSARDEKLAEDSTQNSSSM